MLRRIIPLLFSFSFINAQIALPTFHAVHKPHTTSSSSGPYTFTKFGTTGKNGPSQSNCNSEYSGTSLDGEVTVSSGIQTWTVPSSGTYTIEVWGADGGNGDDNYGYESLGGNGRKLKANFSLVQGAVLKILVGQRGGYASSSSNSTNAGGGGYNGGTVVNTNQYNTEYPSYGAGSFTADNASSIVDIGTNDGVGKVVITKN
tara:strand:+ start:103 stop:708 length:606 start_codon:yes stop_codon:yes gene_type:complete